MFFMRLSGITLFGSSPEAMVQCSGGRLLIAPIAGSRCRGRSVSEDEALAEALLADPHERARHMMLVDLGRSDLGRIAVPASVEVESLMAVERFSQIMHLTSRITARLREGLDAADVLASVFPAGAVSGVPRRKAVEMAAGLEKEPRGPYAGCIGWLGLDKDRAAAKGDCFLFGGDKRDRTADLLTASQALSQLSYTPKPEVPRQNIASIAGR